VTDTHEPGERSEHPPEVDEDVDEGRGDFDSDEAQDRADGGDDEFDGEDREQGDEPPRAAGPDRLHGLIGYILGQIVSKPEEVRIELNESDRRRVYEVRVGADDVGVVIGRSGRTINAIRTLLRGVPDAPERVWVELIEEDEGRGRRPRREPSDRYEGRHDGDAPADEPSHADGDDGHDRGHDGGHDQGDDRGHDQGDDPGRDQGEDRGPDRGDRADENRDRE